MNIAERIVYYLSRMSSEDAQFMLIVIYIMAGLLGAVIGSFLNVVIYRLPNKMSLSFPPSHCPKCNYKLKWYDNIPIISYIILGGKCRKCKEPISFRYTAVEFLNMALWILCVYTFLDGKGGEKVLLENGNKIVYMVVCMIAVSVFLCMAFIDLEHTFIPDSMQITIGVLAVIAIGSNLISTRIHPLAGNPLGFCDGIAWYDRLIGCGGCLVLFLLIYLGGYLAYKREAMGIGDIKLVAVAGLLLGWQNMIVALIVGIVLAAIVLVIARRVRDDEKQHEYPLGPFLVTGILVAMFAGQTLFGLYTSLLKL